jgi:hypothetical protein
LPFILSKTTLLKKLLLDHTGYAALIELNLLTAVQYGGNARVPKMKLYSPQNDELYHVYVLTGNLYMNQQILKLKLRPNQIIIK